MKKTCLSQLKKRSQAPSPGSLTKGRFWQPAMLLDVTSGMSHTFHIINTSWKLDAREVKTELLSDVRRPLGPLDLPTAPSIHHDDPPSTPSTGFSPSARLQLLNRFLQPFAFLVAAGTHLCLDTRRWQEVAGWLWLAPTGPSVWLVSGGLFPNKI